MSDRPPPASDAAPYAADLLALTEAMPQLAWVADETGAVIWCNRRWYDYTGVTPEVMRRDGWRAVHDPAHVEAAVRRFAESIAAGAVFEDIARLRGRDGEFRWFLSRAEPIRDAAGAVVRWLGVSTDVHPQHLAADRFRAAVAAIQGVLWTNDAEGRMLGPQPGWSALTGQTEREYEGYGWSAAVHPEDAAPTVAEWERSVAERRPFVFEHRVRRADGRWGHFAVRAIPVLEADGSIREWVGVHTEITAQRAAEAALRASNEEMQRYTHMVSHDLRAPLVNIMGYTAELLEIRGALFADAGVPDALRTDFDESLGFIRSSTERMDRLLNAILRLSREGQRALRPEPLDLQELVRKLLDGLQHQVVEAGAEVALGALPAVRADRAAVEQVLGNLLDNALKYRAPDRPLRITVEGGLRDGFATVAVSDTGRGIAAHDQSRAFQLFRRVGPQTAAGEGVGLAYVAALARAMGGGVDLRSEVGVGSTFTLRLPSG